MNFFRVFFLIFLGLMTLILGFLILQFFDYDYYEKYKSFCEENNLTIKKVNDNKVTECYEILDNKIIEYYIPEEIDKGVFVLERK